MNSMQSWKKNNSKLLPRTLFFSSFSKIRAHTNLVYHKFELLIMLNIQTLDACFSSNKAVHMLLSQVKLLLISVSGSIFMYLTFHNTHPNWPLLHVVNKYSNLFSKCTGVFFIRQAQLQPGYQIESQSCDLPIKNVYIFLCKVTDSLTWFMFSRTKPQQNFAKTLKKAVTSVTAAEHKLDKKKTFLLSKYVLSSVFQR